MSRSALREQENKLNSKYQDIKVGFQPRLVLSIAVLRCRDVSVGLSDAFDTPDPLIVVSVPTLPAPNKFRTSGHDNSPTAEINETFNFVVPPDFDAKSTPCLVKVKLYDEDILFDDDLGTNKFEISSLTPDFSESKTIVFGTHGEVDIEVKVLKRGQPDYRFGFGLCDEEREFRMKRLPIVHKCLQAVLGQEAPRGLEETPVIALSTSGGAYRSITAMSGATEALHDLGLMDAVTYFAALSGSAWYMESAYVRKGVTRSDQKGFHKFLMYAVQKDLFKELLNPDTIVAVIDDIGRKRKYDQPVSISDVTGLSAGRIFFGEDRIATRQSDLQGYVGGAEVPFPLVVALVVKNTQLASEFHAYMESSPYEISYPNYGIGISPRDFGSVWNNGILARKCPEMPCHFHVGITGSAMALMSKTNVATGEKNEEFLKFVDKERIIVQNSEKKLKDGSSTDQAELDEDENESSDEIEIDDSSTGTNPILQMLKSTLLKTRDSVITRTAKVFNFGRNLESLAVRKLDPFGGTEFVGPEKEELLKLYPKEATQEMSTKRGAISMVDAGLYNNIPAAALLRPQRAVDLMIVFDYTMQPSDEDFTNLELYATAAQCWADGLKFPPIDFKAIMKLPPTECMVFVDDNDDMCPVVVWFQLSNTKFKNLKDYKPRSNVPFDSSKGKFNDFPVYGPGTPYKIIASGLNQLQQERLKDLMYYIVTSNVQVIKDAMAKAVMNKRKRLLRETSAGR